jgi:hypothetical protein
LTYTEAANNEVVSNRKRCGLSSHHNWSGVTLTWPAWTATYKDIYGITLVKKHLAKQIDGISCDTRCKPQPFSTSNASSAWGTLGWTTACGDRGDAVKTGSTARSIAETKCTDEWLEQATVSVTVSGGGASVSFHWGLGGSVDSNGGIYTDSLRILLRLVIQIPDESTGQHRVRHIYRHSRCCSETSGPKKRMCTC